MSRANSNALTERARRRALGTLAFTLFLDMMAFGIILPHLPYYAEAFGASALQVTLLATAFSAAQFVASPLLGRLSDRVGRRAVMLVSIGGSTLAALTLAFASALWIVYAARLVSGLSKANVSTAHACVADLVAPSARAKYMGWMGAAMGGGFVLGPAVGGLLAVDGSPTIPFLAAAALAGLNLALAFLWLPETRAQSDDPEADTTTVPWAEALRAARGPFATLIFATFAYYVSFATMESVLALFTEATFGWGARETGFFLTYVGVCMIVVQGLGVGAFVSRLGEARTFCVGAFTLACGLSSMGFLGEHVIGADAATWRMALLAGSGFAIAGGNGLTMATSGALTAHIAPARLVGTFMGFREGASSLARIVGPLMAGLLFQFVAPGAPFVYGALGAIVAFVLGIRLVRWSDRPKPGNAEGSGQ